MTTALSTDQVAGTTRVLIIEDDPAIAEAVRRVVAKHHGTGVVAGDGRNGLAQFLRRASRPGGARHRAPGMDGWEVLERIRDLSDVPVLILTSHELDRRRYAASTAAPTTT